MKGTVYRWGRERGFGYVAGDDGLEYYCHGADVVGVAEPWWGARLALGDEIEFEPARDAEGRLRAIRVRFSYGARSFSP